MTAPAAPVTSTLTASDGVPLAVTVHEPAGPAGDTDAGVTVVCVHGYPDDHHVWDGVVAALAERHRVVTYDVRGAGASGSPATRAGYRLDQLAADLDTVLTATAADGSVHLLAHDWGSIQTWHAVTGTGPASRVAGYTSVSGPCLDHAALWLRGRPVPGRGPGRRRDRLRQAVASVYVGLFQVPGVPELVWRSGLGRRLSAGLVRVGARGTATPHTAATRDLVDGLELYRANMAASFAHPGERTTTVPVQVLTPTGDPFVTAPLQQAAGFGAADLVVRPVVGGHWVVRDRPAAVAGLVEGFVRDLAARAGS